ncbi:MAG: HlyD family secretion protein [Pseudomonadota bacterium]
MYYSSGYFITYNNDAYVDADLIRVSTTVAGSVAKIGVKDNQLVKKGTLLLQLAQQPFKFNTDLAQSTLNEAIAQKALLAVQLQEAIDDIELKKVQLNLAQSEWERFKKLDQNKFTSQEILDQKFGQYQLAQNALVKAKANKQLIQKQYAVTQARIDQAQNELALRQYDQSISTIYAKTDGIVNNLRIYPGDTVNAGDTLFGFIDNNSWRIVANIKESNLVGVHPGKTVWVYLSSRPWHIYRGKIESIAQGVARQETAPDAALPYVSPVTNWIRYEYRIPVRIRLLDFPANVRLHMGTNARVLIFL